MSIPLRIFVGYDSREHAAFEVCRSSLLRYASVPLVIEALDARKLRHAGLYYRNWIERAGQQIDVSDDRPFSTEFAFTRFLVPAIVQWNGPALFCDCDFLWRADVAELFGLFDATKAVQCVMHQHRPPEVVKMDGQSQGHYHRKNWSSLVLWNCDHPENLLLTPERVNMESGQWLHAFDWLRSAAIAGIPINWNWIENVSSPDIVPKAVHFSAGGPWHQGFEHCAFADEWREEAARIGYACGGYIR
jgi:hypothetical protein